MKERLVQLLDLEQLTPSKFADIIGVQRSSVSHVVSGRNNPSYDFLQKTLKAFPGLNAEWLMLGKGTMYEQMGRGVTGTLFDSPRKTDEDLTGDITEERVNEEPIPGTEISGDEKDDPRDKKTDYQKVPDQVIASDIKVVQVMVFYSDDTFRSYLPSE